ncbi:hypothetical protein BKA61DRAFT_656055 [Leptodontidium sp. MPI-SDFR-AT-0119]|nr:hypothetical protein BKA61DRAFT_656055 [Leptodontidium sp. MPI-SDFR-AT-0119]
MLSFGNGTDGCKCEELQRAYRRAPATSDLVFSSLSARTLLTKLERHSRVESLNQLPPLKLLVMGGGSGIQEDLQILSTTTLTRTTIIGKHVLRSGSGRPRLTTWPGTARLIESIGHIGQIGDFTIKPLQQNSFLVTGISRHTPSRPLSRGTTTSATTEASPTHGDATRICPQGGRAVHTKALASLGGQQSSSDEDTGLSDSDPDPSSDDDRCSSEDEPGRSSTGKNIKWEGLDEQRLLAYKKEGKPWEWIFRKFPGRTRPAIRTRWNMIRPRFE